MVAVFLYVLVAVAILFPFVVVPEILERWGYDPKSRFVRLLVWTVFTVFLLVPATLSGALWTAVTPGDAVIAIFAVTLAILWEYHRLHPGEFP